MKVGALVLSLSLLLSSLSIVYSFEEGVVKYRTPIAYESEWAVHLESGADPSILKELGYELISTLDSLEDIYVVRHTSTHSLHSRDPKQKFVPSSLVTDTLVSHPDVKWAEQQYKVKLHKRAFTDPLFEDQWHLVNTGQFGGTPGVDANIQNAWNMGFNGTGVRIAIVDDGYQQSHPDLSPNFAQDSSYSFNSPVGQSPAPDIDEDFHGTSAAGVALAASNNQVCGIGAAFMAQGAGIRLIAAPVTDATQATALTYKNQLNHIYSNSWGPADDGVDVGGPGRLTKASITAGTQNGRGGLGSIYLWAAGNGGANNDNCNYDGFSAARETIAVAAIGNDGIQSYYSEPCAALLVAAPSSSANSDAGIRTSDLVGAPGYDGTSCTASFGGTSSACPLVSGIVALILQANPLLGWRDVHYILATTAALTDPTDSDWTKNGAGYHVNHKYGFGRVDATAAVLAAQKHKNLPDQVISSTGTISVKQTIKDYPNAGVTASVTVTDEVTVEKVVVTVTIDHRTSGDLNIVLTSPSGTQSVLATTHAIVPAIYINNNPPYPVESAVTFGGPIPAAGVAGKAVMATPITCTTIQNCNALAGSIGVLGSFIKNCKFTDYAKTMQTCGALAAVIPNPDTKNPFDPISMGGTDKTITIPVVSVSYNTSRLLTAGAAVMLKLSQYAANNYKNGWQMSTTRCLDEPAQGTWKIQVTDGVTGITGTFNSFSLNIYGTGKVAPNKNTSGGSGGISTVAKVAISVILIGISIAIVAGVVMYRKNGNIFGYSFSSANGRFVKSTSVPLMEDVEVPL